MLAETSDKSIKDNGERMVPAFHKGALVYGEHLTRYESVVDLVKNKTVLDIASGSGYGSYILAEKAVKVYGVDINQESITYAKRNYARSNIEFLRGSGEVIPLNDHSVDAVISFETIEHIKNYKKFLHEIKRVLQPGGLFVISTPNDIAFPEDNRFHLHEFKYKELDSLLRQYFKNVCFSFQYTWIFAGLMSESEANHEGELNMELNNLAKLPKEKALYFIAICSDGSIDKLRLKSVGALSQHYSARAEQETLNRLHSSIQSTKKELESFKKELTDERQRAMVFGRDLIQARNELKQIYNSKGWRLLTKFYTAKKALSEALRRK